jgi:hypothetical protein
MAARTASSPGGRTESAFGALPAGPKAELTIAAAADGIQFSA